jgi:predicted ATPase
MARTHVEQALALHRPDRQPYSTLLRYARNPAVHMRSTLSWILWYLGLPDQARTRSEEALALARKVSDPFGLALSLIFAAELHQYRREVQLARGYADAAIALSSDQGFPLYLGWGTILRGWALAEQGSHEEGITQIHQGLSAHEATGAALGRPRLLALLAHAYGKAGQAEAGLRVLSEALALVNNTGERLAEPMLLWLKGELILMLSGDEAGSSTRAKEAEACFQAAIAIAHDQGARSVELKGALSVARLWQRCGKTDAARSILAGIHGTFTEGFDTVDWQDAKVLLEELT